MVHEQSRNDRDDYDEYHCDRVLGFKEALEKAMADGLTEEQARKDLCEDFSVAHKYDFRGDAFTKNNNYKNIPMILDEPDGFDLQSVMLYSSMAFAPALASLYTDYCPLLKIDRVNGKKVGVSRIESNVAPSAKDVAFVKNYYPWESAVETPPEVSPRPSPGTPPPMAARNFLNIHKLEL